MAERIIPTRSNLLRAKQDMTMIAQGAALLDQKREVLILELMEVMARLKEQAARARDALAAGYKAIDQAELAMGVSGLDAAGYGPSTEAEISAIERSVMGVAVPDIRIERAPERPPGGLGSTVPELDEGQALLRDAVPEILKWAELHMAAQRLAGETRKSQRRVNALDEVVMPETAKRIETITSALEEAEREEFFRRKRVRSKLRMRAEAEREA